MRDPLRRQLDVERRRELQRDGRRAEERGAGPEDAEALVDDLRGGRG